VEFCLVHEAWQTHGAGPIDKICQGSGSWSGHDLQKAWSRRIGALLSFHLVCSLLRLIHIEREACRFLASVITDLEKPD